MSSALLLRRALRDGLLVGLGVGIVATVVGALVRGTPGALGGVAGAAVAAAFVGLTAGSILIAARITRGDAASPLYFGIVLGAWVAKMVVFVALMFVVPSLPGVDPAVFGITVLAVVLLSLGTDVAAFLRTRVPILDDPREAFAGERPDARPGS